MATQLLGGLFLASAISLVAYLTKNLASSGAYAAAVLGTVVFGLGGWQWAIVLLAFFATSSVLSRGLPKPTSAADDKYAKGGRRDWGQVLGNGTVAATFVLAQLMFPGMAWPWLGFCAAVAAVNADTWATEIGALARSAPRLITDLTRTVEPGTSGAVSVRGTLAAASGSALIALLASTLGPPGTPRLFLAVFTGGLLGAIFDSFLGATVQGIFRCNRDGIETEQHPLHRCGSPTVLIRGWGWLNNDWVNLGCSASGALLALAIGTGMVAG